MTNRRRLIASCAALAILTLGACSPLSTLNTLGPRDLAHHPGRDIAYGPDPRQRLDVYTQIAPSVKLAPIVVFFYGGGWNSGSRTDYSWVGDSLASRGFVAVVPDYRLAPEHPYPAFVQDGAAAVRWARDHAADFGGDPDRIVLAGHSAGAYIALQLALDDTFLRAAGVDPRSIRGAVSLSGPADFYPFTVKESQEAFGAYPDPRDTQPINHVHPGAPPIFLGHGDKDETVELSNSVHLANALKAAGDPVVLKIYPGLKHPDTVLALSRLFRGKAPVLADITQFITDVTAK
jgi:acetyl esterase/lipase